MQKKNYENSNISPCKNIIFKKPSKRNQNPWRYHNSLTNLKFPTQAKIWYFKNPHIKATVLYNESKHNILALVGEANKWGAPYLFRWDQSQQMITILCKHNLTLHYKADHNHLQLKISPMVKYLCVSNAHSLRCQLRAGTNSICGPSLRSTKLDHPDWRACVCCPCMSTWACWTQEANTRQCNAMYGKVPSNYTTIVLKLHYL